MWQRCHLPFGRDYFNPWLAGGLGKLGVMAERVGQLLDLCQRVQRRSDVEMADGLRGCNGARTRG